jgi:hypothetical protein
MRRSLRSRLDLTGSYWGKSGRVTLRVPVFDYLECFEMNLLLMLLAQGVEPLQILYRRDFLCGDAAKAGTPAAPL